MAFMFFGVAKEIITPPFKMQIACTGEYLKDYETIHDDVYVRCLVLKDDSSTSILISYDLLFHDRSLNEQLCGYANSVYGVKKDAVLVACTHAHTAPAVKGYNPGHHDDRYEEYIVEKGKLCIDKAMASLFEGYIEYGSMDINLNISRRGKVNGVYTNAPNFNYVHDQELFLLCIKNLVGEIKAITLSYACHPVFYPAFSSVSGEFPAKLCSLLDEKYNIISLYFQSAGGDVRPLATLDKGENGVYKWKKGSLKAKKGDSIFVPAGFEIDLLGEAEVLYSYV